MNLNNFFAKHRILISRIIAILFAIVLIFTKPILLDTIIYLPMLFIGFILVMIGILGRIFSSLFLSDNRNNKVVITGMYSVTRNPLYFFSFIGVVGIFFIYASIICLILVILFYMLYYSQVIRFEENDLSEKLGISYTDYLSSGVPRFFPKFSKWSAEEHIRVNYKVVKKTIIESSYFFFIALAVLFILLAQVLGLIRIFIIIL